jgi:hypothetical protein
MLFGAHRAVHIYGELQAAMILLLEYGIGHSRCDRSRCARILNGSLIAIRARAPVPLLACCTNMYLSPNLVRLTREALQCGNKMHGAENILPY